MTLFRRLIFRLVVAAIAAIGSTGEIARAGMAPPGPSTSRKSKGRFPRKRLFEMLIQYRDPSGWPCISWSSKKRLPNSIKQKAG